jgi:hypothetical protein
MKTARAALAVVLALSCVMMTNTSLYGWGPIGHMAVAYVAYQQLTPAIKDRVAVLLKLNPDYDKWTAQIPKGTKASDKAMLIFMIAATWPDQIKSETGYTDDGSDDGNRPDGAPSSQNTGYSDHLHHKYWHFVDTPFTQDGSTLNPIPTPNAGSEVAVFRAVLSSSEPDELKSYDLVWTLHLVGDIHQPLHAATRVSKTDPDGDSGGNLVTLCAKPCRDELHGFWDDLPGTGSKTKTAVSYGKKLAKADSTLGSNTDVSVWIKESFDDAQNDVYIAPIAAGDGPFTPTSAYRAAARKVAKDRVALAGARLAALLNNELK